MAGVKCLQWLYLPPDPAELNWLMDGPEAKPYLSWKWESETFKAPSNYFWKLWSLTLFESGGGMGL